MKKILMLVLVTILVLGSIPFSFAEPGDEFLKLVVPTEKWIKWFEADGDLASDEIEVNGWPIYLYKEDEGLVLEDTVMSGEDLMIPLPLDGSNAKYTILEDETIDGFVPMAGSISEYHVDFYWRGLQEPKDLWVSVWSWDGEKEYIYNGMLADYDFEGAFSFVNEWVFEEESFWGFTQMGETDVFGQYDFDKSWGVYNDFDKMRNMTKLYAGQDLLVGTATVGVPGTMFAMDDYYYLKNFQIHIGEDPFVPELKHSKKQDDLDFIPVNKQGSPRPGHFEHKGDYDDLFAVLDGMTFEYETAEDIESPVPGDIFYAIHGKVMVPMLPMEEWPEFLVFE